MGKIIVKIPNAISTVDYEQSVGYRRIICGIDLGTVSDPTAIVCIEDILMPLPMFEKGKQLLEPRRCTVKQALRLKTGITYTQVVDFLKELRADEGFRDDPLDEKSADVRYYVDATGVGGAVSHMLDEKKIPHTKVNITSGDSMKEVDRGYRVSKAWLMTTLGAGLVSGDLKIANSVQDRPELHQQLANFQVSRSASGEPTFAAFGTQHDDLVLAMALAWVGVKTTPSFTFSMTKLTWR